MTALITLTEKAVDRIKANMMAKPDALGIRLFIKEGKGCAGNEYEMEYVIEKAPPGHDMVKQDGAVLYIPFADSLRFFGMSIDYALDNLGNEKFVFDNPNVTSACGCGESVSFTKQKNDPE